MFSVCEVRGKKDLVHECMMHFIEMAELAFAILELEIITILQCILSIRILS
jgi:hypothetical protein